MINFTRKYSSAIVIKEENGLQNIITSIYCICRGEDEETGIFETIGEYIPLEPPIPEEFILYEDLVEPIVESWVVDNQTYLVLEEKVKNAILARINPPIQSMDLPFN